MKTKEKFDELEDVEALPHSVYSPYGGYPIMVQLRSLEHFLLEVQFETFDQAEKTCQEFFKSKPKD
ncbi:hypothetical protein KIN20_035984 [Parelaphostrongylus tenuis]|uniref:Uncharacterized protein n=1 Tax=Parelaphostrongylus tenuis TaxID=148309 RepID=A0AAD5RCC8_PARTN|nr:hypothetical protein KIN20_035984 [Parelaphostrongylus tenuis]